MVLQKRLPGITFAVDLCLARTLSIVSFCLNLVQVHVVHSPNDSTSVSSLFFVVHSRWMPFWLFSSTSQPALVNFLIIFFSRRCFFLFSVRHYCLCLCYNRANSHCIDYGCRWLCIFRYYLIHRRLLVFWLRFLGRWSRRWNCVSRSGLNSRYVWGR